ncbi:hypothetical protein U1872_00805 [Sphingomonas sp. RB3P16]|uniref:hypothetical protein n=1 Tax=Parasphingomonas frigoris TaxID=3096163 RepID=UPI002FC6069C
MHHQSNLVQACQAASRRELLLRLGWTVARREKPFFGRWYRRCRSDADGGCLGKRRDRERTLIARFFSTLKAFRCVAPVRHVRATFGALVPLAALRLKRFAGPEGTSTHAAPDVLKNQEKIIALLIGSAAAGL